MNIAKILTHPRTMQALTGISKREFEDLLVTFEHSFLENKRMASTATIRKFGGGRKGTLATMQEKLFYILFYMKTYPTFDVAGAWFDLDATNACKNTHILLAALEKSLGRKIVLPARKVRSIDELFEKFPEIKDVFVDGLERPVQRPRNQKRQRKLYSGKKKNHTKKSVILTDEYKRVLFLTKSKSGRRHDKRLADKNSIFEHIPEGICVWVDTGFQGVSQLHRNTMMPKKATKKRPLTPEEKQENKLISGIRVIVEHAIGGIKRFRAVSEKYRNHTPCMDDRLLLNAAGLWNLHVQHAA
jgi:hypothetical protein